MACIVAKTNKTLLTFFSKYQVYCAEKVWYALIKHLDLKEN